MKNILLFCLITITLFSCKSNGKNGEHGYNGKSGATAMQESFKENDPFVYESEKHFKNMRQLTFGGDNAEAYWSFDNSKLVFQRRNKAEGVDCDQIYVGDIPKAGEEFKFNLVSTGKGRTTCSYFLHGDTSVIWASTHLGHEACPPEPDKTNGYVWPMYPEFEIFVSDLKGGNLVQLTDNDYYDAEATTSPTENKIVYTSTKTGDIELFVLDLDTKEEIQVTHELGYDGGAFFSPDGTQLIWRSSRPKTQEEKDYYTGLLAKDMVEPSDMELYIGNIDGTNVRKLTELGGANWAPFFHPSGKKIIFCSNHVNGKYPFNLFMINTDGTGLEKISSDNTFDSFPMFSPDGKYLIFSSNRNNNGTKDTNMFLTEWVD
ncbi:MAG: TolB protein [Planctomycetota bacterium]|jgi:TolB protein